MVLTEDGASHRLYRVTLEVERPPLGEWLPPYQFHDKWCTDWPDGRTSSEAEAEPVKYEGLRRSL
eukprot:7864660-Pyramimonas_sp.AAC.1